MNDGERAEPDTYFRLLIDNTLDMITVLDVEGLVVYNSPAVKTYLGYEPGELNGRFAFELIHPDDRETLLASYSDGVRSPSAVQHWEYRFQHKNGSWRFIESMGTNLLDNPDVRGVVVTSRDITDRKRIEEALKRSEEYFRVVMENTMDIIMIIDASASITYINRSSKSILGYNPEEMLGRNALDFVHPEDASAAAETVAAAAKDPGFSPLREVRAIHKDGSICHLEGIGKNFLDHPAVEGIVLSFRDISDRKRAEGELRESEELYRTLVTTSPDGITVTDMNADIIFVSPQLVKMHGFEHAEEMLGTSALDLIAPEDRERATGELAQMMRSGYARNVELTLLRKDGSHFQADLSAALIRDAAGEPRRMVSYTRDISERKKMDAELRERNEELEAFAHTISHDLLSPVAVVEGYAKAALEADAEGRPEAERECLEAIARGARRMSDLINSLLQYAQAGHMDIRESDVDPEEVLLEVLIDLKDEALRRGVGIEVATGLPRIAVDAVKLRQVLSNLISNALKHMGDNPRPEVAIGATVDGPFATFCVRDNGIGIPPELHERVFEPFKHFSLAGTQGLGIGLSTVRRAVTAWGGKVWVRSRPGEGAAFFFTAPLAE
ncbi:MAG: PAS domain-containing sensor histidine kinase [Actinomycetota bacterium]